MQIGFEIVGAKSKRDDGQEQPVQEPMRPTKGLNAPSADQLKARRQLAKSATTLQEMNQAVDDFSDGKRDLKVGDKVGDATITGVSGNTVQWVDPDGWSGSRQVVWNRTVQDADGKWQTVMTKGWERALAEQGLTPDDVKIGSKTAGDTTPCVGCGTPVPLDAPLCAGWPMCDICRGKAESYGDGLDGTDDEVGMDTYDDFAHNGSKTAADACPHTYSRLEGTVADGKLVCDDCGVTIEKYRDGYTTKRDAEERAKKQAADEATTCMYCGRDLSDDEIAPNWGKVQLCSSCETTRATDQAAETDAYNRKYPWGDNNPYAKKGSMKMTASPDKVAEGDVLVVGGQPKDYYSSNAQPGMKGVMDLHTYGPGSIACTFGASAFRPKDGSYVSCSGGPVPEVFMKDLKYVGTTEREFWCWGPNGPGAGNGVTYKATVGLWEWTPPKKTASTTKESPMNREAQILAALPKATTDEQERLAAELEMIRFARRAQRGDIYADAEGARVAAMHLTPVRAHVHHTASTDWLATEAETFDAKAIHAKARAEATVWARRVHAAVKESPAEYMIQAEGYAQVWAGQFGFGAPAAIESFVAQAAHLGGFKTANGIPDGGIPINGPLSNEQEAWLHPPRSPVPYENATPGIRGESDKWYVFDSYNGDAPVSDAFDSMAEAQSVLESDFHNDIVEFYVGSGFSAMGARRTAAADMGPDDDSQSGFAQTGLPQVDVSQTEDTNIGWIGGTDADETDFSEEESEDIGLAGMDATAKFVPAYLRQAMRIIAESGPTCADCGTAIERDPEGETNRTYHHSDGSKHDHEAVPSKSKESSLVTCACCGEVGPADQMVEL
jgi:hypothetical protein